LIRWRAIELDRKIELFLIFGGVIVGAIVMINNNVQLEQMKEQTKAMKDQLAEVKSGGADTKAIAEAAKVQADNTKLLAEAAVQQVKETHELAVATQESVRFAREQFNKGMRPSVRVVRTQTKFVEGEKGAINVFYANIGKLPALGLRTYGKLITGDTASEIAKGHESTETTEFFKRKAKSAEAGETFMAGEPHRYFTVSSASVLSATDIQKIKERDAGWAVLILIEYFDDGGTYYFTELCRFGFRTGAIAYCKIHNR
jgi:hypothetical protein